nr:HDOD domain-containing protein [Marinibactrum halimedae]
MRQDGVARAVLLQDQDGNKLQVVLPGNCLLDVQRLMQLTGRQLQAVKPAEVERFLTSKKLDGIPAIPNISGLETIIDTRLTKADAILMDTGKSPHLLKVEADALQSMLSDNAQTLDIASPIEALETTPNKDDSEKNIFQAVTNFTQLRIKRRLEDTLELPPLPETAQKIIKLRVDPNADISDLSAIVETDPSLAAQVVSWASSPYYSAPGKIRSIHDAIVRVLGFDMVLNLALGIALSKTLTIPRTGPYGSPPYWKSAVYAAATMEGLVTAMPRQSRPGFGLAYLSGLLHNFGYLIIAEIFPPHYHQLVNAWESNPHVNQQIIEKHHLGVTRAELASWLMEVWNMPEEVVVALRHQNNPAYRGEHSVYANLMCLTQTLLSQRSIGNMPAEPIDRELLAALQLDENKLIETMENIMNSAEELENIAKSLGGGE